MLAELEVEQHLEMLRGAYEMCILERPHLIGVLTSYMPIENTLSLLDSLLQAVEPGSDQWRSLLTEIHRSLDAERWLRVVPQRRNCSTIEIPSRRYLAPTWNLRPAS